MKRMKLVPCVATDAMVHEQYAQYGGSGLDMDGRYKAMLSASPALTPEEVDDLAFKVFCAFKNIILNDDAKLLWSMAHESARENYRRVVRMLAAMGCEG